MVTSRGDPQHRPPITRTARCVFGEIFSATRRTRSSWDRGADIVIAQVGAPLLWPQRSAIRDFWRETPKSGYYFAISHHDQLIHKESAPTYLFYPSEWEAISEFPLVLLEMVCYPYDPALKMF